MDIVNLEINADNCIIMSPVNQNSVKEKFVIKDIPINVIITVLTTIVNLEVFVDMCMKK